MKRIIGLIVLTGFVIVLAACGKNKTTPGDEHELSIKILETSVPVTTAEVCGVDHDNVLKLTTGIPLTLKMQFKGAQELSQYKIDIHANFDCHGHERPLSEWQFLKVEDLSGKEAMVTETIPLPTEAFTGNYHCIIRLIDASGNEAEFVEFSLIVSNSEDSEPPVISLQQPASDSIAVNRGDVITFQGAVTDNLSLKNGRLEITYVDAAGADYTAIIENFSAQEYDEHAFERTYEVPAFAATGTAVFTLRAFDEFNNTSERRVKVNILP